MSAAIRFSNRAPRTRGFVMLHLIRSASRLWLAFFLLLSPAWATTEAGGFQRFDALAPKGAQAGRGFGSAIAVEGDLAVVGAPNEAVDGRVLQGAAYVFTHADGRWRQRARLVLADGSASMQFGAAVTISGSQILVGAPGSTGGGQVYVFDGGGASWSESQRFQPAGAGGFGYALAAQADRLLVGAPEESGGGAAYVYTRTAGSWGGSVRLLAANRGSGDKFGRAVALDGDHAVVGAPFQGALSSGSAYPFRFDGSQWQAGAALNRITTSSAYEGWRLAIRSDHLLVGVPGEDRDGVNSTGAVLHYVFGAGNWQFQARMDGPQSALASFGQALDFDGSQLLIGAPGVARSWGRRGQVFSAELGPSGFGSLQTLPDADMADGVGRSLARFAGGLLTGDPFSRVGGASADGRVTVLRLDADNWRVDGVLDAPEIDVTRRFGRVVSVSGNRAAVGMPWENNEQGSVQLFDFDGQRWVWSATVVDPLGNAGDRFGSSLALDGDHLIVGAPNRDNSGTSNGGSALVFEFDGSNWSSVWRYDNSIAADDYLGTAVALDGERGAIGAPRSEDGGLTDGGLVIVLERNAGSWSNVRNLPGQSANERLGSALSFAGGTLAAGASNADTGAGRVRIYRKLLGNWSQLTSIVAPAGSAGFGSALDLRDGLLAVGAPNGDTGLGRVAVYREGTTAFSAETLPAIPFAGQRAVGTAVSIDAGRLIAGGLDSSSDSAGLFVFDRDAGGSWGYSGRIASPEGSSLISDGFGSALSLRRPHLLAGAEWRARDEGRAFAYIEARATMLQLDSFSPTQPVSGQPVVITGSASDADGAVDGVIRWEREDGQGCSVALVGGSGACSLPGIQVGTHLVSGEFLPDTLPDLPQATAAAGYVVVRADSSVSLSATPASVHPGQTITLDATVSAVAPGSGVPDGSLRFYAGDPDSAAMLCEVPVATGQCTLAAGAVGSAGFQVRYAGDADFNGADSPLRSVSITPWPATVLLSNLDPLPVKVGQPLSALVQVAADAAAGTPAGRVRLVLDGQPGDWVMLDGSAQASPVVIPLRSGAQSVWAEFDGQGGSFADSSGGSQSVTVLALSSSVVLGATPDSGVHAGDTVRLTATVSLEDGSVASGNLHIHADSAANPPLCTLAAPSGSCDVTPSTSGSHDFVAVYDGDIRAAGSNDVLSLPVQAALTAITITSVAPASPKVDESYQVSVQVTADYGLPGGTVSVGDGESSCQLTLVNQAGSCALTATYRGNRSINAHYTPDNGVHAASDAPVASIEVQGIAVSLTLDLPVGPNTVGDSIVLTPEIVAADASDTSGGILSLRLDDAAGSVVCSGNPPLVACPLTLPAAGVQHFHLAYSGSPRHEPSENVGYSLAVDPSQSTLAVQGVIPATVITDSAFELRVAVTGELGTPDGTLDVSDENGAVCSGLARHPGDSLFHCGMTAPSQAGGYPLTLAFHANSDNDSDAGGSYVVFVSSAIRQISLQLDDGVNTVQAGDPLAYVLEVHNLAASGTVSGLLLDQTLIEGIGQLQWQCELAQGGAVCPVAGAVAGKLYTHVDLPPASLIIFSIQASVLDPSPPTIETGVIATLPIGESNDDPDALYAVDVDFRADGWLFGDGFEGEF
ncbi:MAG: hypothetical protein R3F12_04675 [Lysobacteraceae bacterium]|nr:hypothetical protein [Xanthomonadaceae bacterium]HRX99552.1 hypothetical protein [Xanthomonadaceae bacterium]